MLPIWIRYLYQDAQDYGLMGRLPLILVASTVVMFVIFVGTVVNLAAALGNQQQLGQFALEVQEGDFTRRFSQIQRTSLRLQAYVATPVAALDRDEAELQIDLLASFFFQLGTIERFDGSRNIQIEYAQNLLAQEADLLNVARRWLDDPTDEVVAQAFADRLVALEQETIDYIDESNRFNVRNLIAFRDATNRARTAQLLATLILVPFILLVLTDVYLYLRQLQETEAARQSLAFKDHFLAVMSHELRTPLNAIIGFLGIMAMQRADSTKFPHMIERASVNAERLLNLIDDILDISKIQAGRFELYPEVVDVHAVVQQWQKPIEFLAQEKGVAFESHIDAALPSHIIVDADALGKIINNLLSNALKFTDKGAVRLNIQRQDHEWVLQVTDTGIGIPPDRLGAIFESFRQVDGSIGRQFGGSGLGLSIVKQLTELQGGHVTVASVVGEGSTFTVTLPLVVAPSPTTDAMPTTNTAVPTAELQKN